MTVQPSADRLEYEAEQRAKRQQSDGTYYGSTTTGATPQTPVAQPQPQYYGGTPTSPSGYAPAPPVYYGGTPTAPYSPAQPTGYRAFPDVVIPPNINVPDYDYSSAAAYQAAWDASRAPAVYAYYLQRFGGNTEQATIASMAVDEGFNIAPRELSAMQRFRRRETERTLAEQAPKSLQDFPSLSLSAREQSALNRFRTKYAVEMMMGRGGEFLERHPTFLNAIAGAVEAQQFTPEDARRLVNLGQLDSAFNAYLDAVNDPRAQRDILMSMDSIQRAAAMDYFMEKFRELQEFSEQDPGWAEMAWNTFFQNVVEPINNGLLWLSDTSQQAARAATLSMLDAREQGMGSVVPYAIPGVNTVAISRGVAEFWDQASPDSYDQEYLDTLRSQYGSEVVDALLRLEELKRDGEPDPGGRWIAEYAGTPLQNIVRGLFYLPAENPQLVELSRLINTAHKGNTGMVALSALPEEWRKGFTLPSGENSYDLAAAAINVTSVFVLDPTIIASKLIGVHRAARYGLFHLSTEAGIDKAFAQRRTRTFFNEFGRDWNRIENSGLDGAQKALARDVMRSQYGKYLPDDVMDEIGSFMKQEGRYDATAAHNWFKDTSLAEAILAGNVGRRGSDVMTAAVQAAKSGRKYTKDEIRSLAIADRYSRIAGSTQPARREKLVPGRNFAGTMRARTRRVLAFQNPVNRHMAQDLKYRIGGTGADDVPILGEPTPEEVAAYLAGDAFERGVTGDAPPLGVVPRSEATTSPFAPMNAGAPRYINQAVGKVVGDNPYVGWTYADSTVSAKLDRFFRKFARAPMTETVYLLDGRDAKTIYQFARAFLPRYHATFIADAFRNAPNEAVRKQIFNGLVKNAVAARGLRPGGYTFFKSGGVYGTASWLGGEAWEAKTWADFLPEVKRGGTYSPSVLRSNGRVVDPASDVVQIPVWRQVPKTTSPSGNRVILDSYTDKSVDGLNQANVTRFTQIRESSPEWFEQRDLSTFEGAALRDVTDKQSRPDVRNGNAGDWYVKPEHLGDFHAKWLETYLPGLTDDAEIFLYRGLTTETPTGGVKAASPAHIFGEPGQGSVRSGMVSWWTFDPDVAVTFAGSGSLEQVATIRTTWGELSQYLKRDSGGSPRVPGYSAPTSSPHEFAVTLDYTAIPKSWRDSAVVQSVDEFRATAANAVDNGVDIVEDTRELIINPVVEADTLTRQNPAEFNGQQKPLHLWQTADYVRMPNFAEIDEASVKASLFGALFGPLQGSIAQNIVDVWSLGNLFGPRYFLRNAVEDWTFYAITQGSLPNFARGKSMSNAVRAARGKKPGFIKKWFYSDNQSQFTADEIESDPTVRAVWSAISAGFTEEDVVAAGAAMRQGDVTKMRQLVGLSLVRQKMGGLDSTRLNDALDFVTEHGEKMIDEVTEYAMYGASGLYPGLAYADNAASVAEDSIDGVVTNRIVYPRGKYTEIKLNDKNNPLRFVYWHRGILGAADNDGPIGKVVLRDLWMGKDRDQIVERVAQIVDEDRTVGYKKRLAAFYEDGVSTHDYAARYVDDVANLVSKPDGTVNRAILDKIVYRDPESGLVRVETKTNGELNLTASDLRQVKSEDRPLGVLGRESNNIPEAVSIKGMDRIWSWMGEQYSRIAREPIFLAHYFEQRELLRPFERQLTELVGEKAARAQAGKLATDMAYEFTLSYTDNPRARTMFAWNMRNVARYYRATEDFARRMLRLAKNYPVGIWKVALAYDVLEDTSFVFTDEENGEKYFVYPGSSAAAQLMQGGLSFLGMGGVELDPVSYEMLGNVRMLSPSADPQQWMPTLSSNIVAFPLKTLFNIAPALKSFEQAVLGEYSEEAELWQTLFPTHFNRLINAINIDQRESMYASIWKDAVQIAAAAGALPDAGAREGDVKKFLSDMNGLVRSLLYLRLGAGLVLPAAPRLTAKDVTDVAREAGLVNTNAAFRSLVRQAAEDGSQNPVRDASMQFFTTFGIDAVPITISTLGDDPFAGLDGLPSLVATVEGEKWIKENDDLINGRTDKGAFRFRTPALWLIPRTGDYSGDMMQWMANAGLKAPKDISQVFEEARMVKARFVLLQNKMQYEADLVEAEQRWLAAYRSGDEAAADAIRDEISQLRLDWSNPDYQINGKPAGVYQELVGDFPEMEQETFETDGDALKRVLDNEMRPMMNYIFRVRPKMEEFKGKEFDPAAYHIFEAIKTFDDILTDISRYSGSSTANESERMALKIEGRQTLVQMSAVNDNARVFVELVLLPLLEQGGYLPPGVTPTVAEAS